MKKIFLVIIIGLLGFSVNAQDKKLKKEIEEKERLKSELSRDLSDLDFQIDKIRNRSFMNDGYIKKKLAQYDSIAALAKDLGFRRTLKKSSLNKTYSQVIDMYFSIQDKNTVERYQRKIYRIGYQKGLNEYYKQQLEEFRKSLSALDHKDSFMRSFDELSELIKDYEFTMTELVRVFDVVDEKNKDMDSGLIYENLKNEGETVFIDRIPFTYSILKQYIIADEQGRTKIKGRSVFSWIKK